jgi:hypothetical protein
MQMEQDADSVWFGWLWVDSTTAVQNINDRQSQGNHRNKYRMRSGIGLDSFKLILVASHNQRPARYYGTRATLAS